MVLPGSHSPLPCHTSWKQNLLSCRYNLSLSSSQHCLTHTVLSQAAGLCVAHCQHLQPVHHQQIWLVVVPPLCLLAPQSDWQVAPGLSSIRPQDSSPRPHCPVLLTSLPKLHIASITLAHAQHVPCHQPDTLCVSVLKPHKKGQGPSWLTCSPSPSRAGTQAHSSTSLTRGLCLPEHICSSSVLTQERSSAEEMPLCALLSRVLCSKPG